MGYWNAGGESSRDADEASASLPMTLDIQTFALPPVRTRVARWIERWQIWLKSLLNRGISSWAAVEISPGSTRSLQVCSHWIRAGRGGVGEREGVGWAGEKGQLQLGSTLPGIPQGVNCHSFLFGTGVDSGSAMARVEGAGSPAPSPADSLHVLHLSGQGPLSRWVPV